MTKRLCDSRPLLPADPFHQLIDSFSDDYGGGSAMSSSSSSYSNSDSYSESGTFTDLSNGADSSSAEYLHKTSSALIQSQSYSYDATTSLSGVTYVSHGEGVGNDEAKSSNSVSGNYTTNGAGGMPTEGNPNGWSGGSSEYSLANDDKHSFTLKENHQETSDDDNISFSSSATYSASGSNHYDESGSTLLCRKPKKTDANMLSASRGGAATLSM